jgi:hypothetical protein
MKPTGTSMETHCGYHHHYTTCSIKSTNNIMSAHVPIKQYGKKKGKAIPVTGNSAIKSNNKQISFK